MTADHVQEMVADAAARRQFRLFSFRRVSTENGVCRQQECWQRLPAVIVPGSCSDGQSAKGRLRRDVCEGTRMAEGAARNSGRRRVQQKAGATGHEPIGCPHSGEVRLRPGGCAVSREISDADAGSLVATPRIRIRSIGSIERTLDRRMKESRLSLCERAFFRKAKGDFPKVNPAPVLCPRIVGAAT